LPPPRGPTLGCGTRTAGSTAVALGSTPMPRVIGGSIEAHRREARARVFAAFARLMYERGYDAITLADIAEAAGMARTSMYNYYPSKEALLIAYTDDEMQRFLE